MDRSGARSADENRGPGATHGVADVQSLTEVRQALSGGATGVVSQKLSPKEIRELGEENARLCKALDDKERESEAYRQQLEAAERAKEAMVQKVSSMKSGKQATEHCRLAVNTTAAL